MTDDERQMLDVLLQDDHCEPVRGITSSSVRFWARRSGERQRDRLLELHELERARIWLGIDSLTCSNGPYGGSQLRGQCVSK